ncbi:hypothetical protein Bbelb_325030 [Branchiostoma belcheri]|nr:hypothetical protein Bbelb_325030 [Branchiostoma belcheri]
MSNKTKYLDCHQENSVCGYSTLLHHEFTGRHSTFGNRYNQADTASDEALELEVSKAKLSESKCENSQHFRRTSRIFRKHQCSTEDRAITNNRLEDVLCTPGFTSPNLQQFVAPYPY